MVARKKLNCLYSHRTWSCTNSQYAHEKNGQHQGQVLNSGGILPWERNLPAFAYHDTWKPSTVPVHSNVIFILWMNEWMNQRENVRLGCFSPRRWHHFTSVESWLLYFELWKKNLRSLFLSQIRSGQENRFPY